MAALINTLLNAKAPLENEPRRYTARAVACVLANAIWDRAMGTQAVESSILLT